MKALGFALFAPEFPGMEIETKVGLRYKPDLAARDASGKFLFWGEAGDNSLRKTNWLLKHARVERLVLFKVAAAERQLVRQLREEIPAKYRPPERVVLINFRVNIAELTRDKQIEKVSADWFSRTVI